MKLTFLISAFTIFGAVGACAQPTILKQFDAWGVYSYSMGGSSSCYMLTIPTHEEPSGVDHGKNYFLLAPTRAADAEYEPQAMMGYPLKAGPSVSVRIGDHRFRMFTKERNAWLRNPARVPEMVDAMRAGRR